MFTRNFYTTLAENFSFYATSTSTNNHTFTTSHIGNGTTRYIFAEGTNALTIYNGGTTNTYINANYPPRQYIPLLTTNTIETNVVFINPYQTVSSSSVQTPLFYGGVFFGTGTTPATIDDYAFSGEFITNCTASYSYNNEVLEDGMSAKKSIVYTITNNNETEITIGEIGLLIPLAYRTQSSIVQHTYVLLEHTTLDIPITIEAGGVGQVTYVLQLNAPTT